MRKAYLLAGATAVGKSGIAAKIARSTGAAVLSADSMLVYKGMDIGTDKPRGAEREGYILGGVDLVTPADEFSSGAWLRAARSFVATIPHDAPLIIVGGTGLYFSALLRGLDRPWRDPPPEYPVVQMDRTLRRERIAARIERMFADGLEEEWRRLKALYPVWSRTAAAAIGYKELEAPNPRERIFIRTCQYAKRQDTWFRHQALAIPVEADVDSVRRAWHAHGPWEVDL